MRAARIALLVFVILCLATVAGVAQPSLLAESNVSVSSSWFGLYVGSEPHVMWKPTWFGLGAGVKLVVGASQLDIHAVPFARVEAGWCYLSGGWSFELLDLTSRYQMMGDGVVVAAGVAPDLVSFGYGRLGVDLGLETIIRMPYGEAEPPPSELILGPASEASWLGTALGFLVETTLLRVGLLYTFPL
jgi:hypothetical protein